MLNTMRIATYARASIALMLLLFLCFAASPTAVFAQLGAPAPYATPQFFDNSGNACANCTINTYTTGTTTELDTFTTSALSVANANPIVLNSAGRANIFLTPGLTYRFVLNTAAGAAIWTQDGINGLNGVSANRLRLSTHSVTLATGAFTATYSQYAVDTESAAATDELDTITAGTGVGAGFVLVLTPANVSRVVTARTGVGNLRLSGDLALNSAASSLTLYYDGSNWVELARAGGGSVDLSRCDGRLTLTTATPVTTVDVTAATTMYFAPYQGNQCAIYNGSNWAMHTFTERSLALGTLSNATNYDVFLYNNSGTLTLEFTAWSGDTTRATALTTQDGVYVRTGATTRRYLGTFRTNAATTTADSFAERFLWNYYHRVRRVLRVLEATNSWAYTTATYRQANAAVANQLALVVGVAEDELTVEVVSTFSNTNVGVQGFTAIGADSTTTAAASQFHTAPNTPVAAYQTVGHASLSVYPAAGYHFYAWLERSSATGTMTWYGDDGDATLTQNGIFGVFPM